EPELAAGLDRFLSVHDASVVFVPFQRLATSREDDTGISRRVIDYMRYKDRAELIESELQPHEIVDLFRSCDLVVGMRLHSMIMAILAGTPAIALSYDPKVDHVMERTGLTRFSIDLKSLDQKQLAYQITIALAASADIRTQIAAARTEMSALASTNAEN